MSLASVSRMEAKLLLPTYERQPILFVRGRGVYLWDSRGQRYLDFLTLPFRPRSNVRPAG
jgi:acetylornithine aminotransferase/acetylornithine/N-succinyldiaminopimelate aminotransferase